MGRKFQHTRENQKCQFWVVVAKKTSTSQELFHFVGWSPRVMLGCTGCTASGKLCTVNCNDCTFPAKNTVLLRTGQFQHDISCSPAQILACWYLSSPGVTPSRLKLNIFHNMELHTCSLSKKMRFNKINLVANAAFKCYLGATVP